jgi:hypothetical protein
MTHQDVPDDKNDWFLLVAPLEISAFEPEGRPEAEVDDSRRIGDADGFILLSRHAYLAQELRQEWFRLPARESVQGVRRAWRVSLKEAYFLVAECSLPIANSEVHEIETALSRVASSLCREEPMLLGGTPLWVNRTHLLPSSSDATSPDGWLTRLPTTRHLQDDYQRPIEATLGWGNNTFRGWDQENDQFTQKEAIMGLVDAQFLWNELSSTGSKTAAIAHTVIERSMKISRQEFSKHLDSLDRMSDAIVLHRLNYDDLLMNVQGPRHDVARACLDVWGYREVFERVAARLPSVADVTERELARSSRKYQQAVQTILTLVALLAVVNFVAVLYSIAIIGTGTIPINLSNSLRVLNASSFDLILLFGLAAVPVILLLMRRGDRGPK